MDKKAIKRKKNTIDPFDVMKHKMFRRSQIHAINDFVICLHCKQWSVPLRTLACWHNVCQTCILRYYNHFDPGEKIFCKKCDNESYIPVGGLIALKVNKFVVKLATACSYETFRKDVPLCQPCSDAQNRVKFKPVCTMMTSSSSISSSESEIRVATALCVRCALHMCAECAEVHFKQTEKSAWPHHLHVLGSIPDVAKWLSSTREICCSFPRRDVEAYCDDCRTSCCTVCLSQLHRLHKAYMLGGPGTRKGRDAILSAVERMHELLRWIDDVISEELERYAREPRMWIERRAWLHADDLDDAVAGVVLAENMTRAYLEQMEVLLQRFSSYSLSIVDVGSPADVADFADRCIRATKDMAELVSVEALTGRFRDGLIASFEITDQPPGQYIEL